ncbi:MAG: hypothetical protein PHE84_10480 [bacterium]|nr:hypothetical protein [bacterium]
MVSKSNVQKYSFRGKTLTLKGLKTINFPKKIVSVKKRGRFIVVKTDASGNEDRDAMFAYGIDENGKIAWQFFRGIFSNRYPEARFYLNGKRLPDGSQDWPQEIDDALFGKQREKPPKKTRKPRYSAEGKTLILPSGQRMKFENKIKKVLRINRVYVLLLEPAVETGLKPYLVCVTKDRERLWEFKREKEEFDEIIEPTDRVKKGLVRAYSRTLLVVDLDVRTGEINRAYSERCFVDPKLV